MMHRLFMNLRNPIMLSSVVAFKRLMGLLPQ